MRLPFQYKSLIRLLLIFNSGVIFSLLLAYLAPYLSPAVFWPVAFFGLGFPIIVVANLAFSFLWIFIKPRYAFISLIAVLAGINPLCRQWQWNSKPGKASQNSINIVSFNVHDFSGLEDGIQKKSTREEIFNFLGKTNSQIICLQDMPFFFPDHSLVLPALSDKLGMKQVFSQSLKSRRKNSYSLTSLLTSFPVIDTGEVVNSGVSFAIYADLVIKRDTIRVYSVHLASTKLYGAKELLTAQGIAESGKRGIPRRIFHIIKSLRSAFINRATQADILRISIDQSPYPVIVCGDHNDTPLSYAIHTIRKGLNDSFVARGNGFGRTYGESSFPLRIDYVMASSCFSFEEHKTIATKLSDHLPVVVKVGWHEKGR